MRIRFNLFPRCKASFLTLVLPLLLWPFLGSCGAEETPISLAAVPGQAEKFDSQEVLTRQSVNLRSTPVSREPTIPACDSITLETSQPKVCSLRLKADKQDAYVDQLKGSCPRKHYCCEYVCTRPTLTGGCRESYCNKCCRSPLAP